MDREGPAFFQHPQRLEQDLLPIAGGDIVIDVVARDRVEALVRKIEPERVAPAELRIADALGLGVRLAQRLVVGGVLLAPAVEADETRLRIAPGAGDRQRAAPAARVQPQDSPQAVMKAYLLFAASSAAPTSFASRLMPSGQQTAAAFGSFSRPLATKTT